MSVQPEDVRHIKKEIAKAKKLRSTSWWKNKIQK